MITLENDSYFFQCSHNVILQCASIRIQTCTVIVSGPLRLSSSREGSFVVFPSFLVTCLWKQVGPSSCRFLSAVFHLWKLSFADIPSAVSLTSPSTYCVSCKPAVRAQGSVPGFVVLIFYFFGNHGLWVVCTLPTRGRKCLSFFFDVNNSQLLPRSLISVGVAEILFHFMILHSFAKMLP